MLPAEEKNQRALQSSFRPVRRCLRVQQEFLGSLYERVTNRGAKSFRDEWYGCILWKTTERHEEVKARSGERVKRVLPRAFRALSEGVLEAEASGCGGTSYRTVVQVVGGAASQRVEIDRRRPHSLKLNLAAEARQGCT